jgi:hypothetical protein
VGGGAAERPGHPHQPSRPVSRGGAGWGGVRLARGGI